MYHKRPRVEALEKHLSMSLNKIDQQQQEIERLANVIYQLQCELAALKITQVERVVWMN